MFSQTEIPEILTYTFQKAGEDHEKANYYYFCLRRFSALGI